MTTIFDRTAAFGITVATARDMIEKFTSHQPLAGLKVLDVGCRNGESVRALTDLGADAYGVDIAPRCIEQARSRFPELSERFFCADMRELRAFPVHGFDRVLCIGALPYVPPGDWLAVIAGMGALCRADGEVRVLLQREKSRPVRAAVRLLSALPEPVYARAVAPWVTAALGPLAPRLLGGAMGREELHYRVSLSLYGLHFGVPEALRPYAYPVPPCAYISPQLSEAFAIPACVTAEHLSSGFFDATLQRVQSAQRADVGQRERP